MQWVNCCIFYQYLFILVLFFNKNNCIFCLNWNIYFADAFIHSSWDEKCWNIQSSQIIQRSSGLKAPEVKLYQGSFVNINASANILPLTENMFNNHKLFMSFQTLIKSILLTQTDNEQNLYSISLTYRPTGFWFQKTKVVLFIFVEISIKVCLTQNENCHLFTLPRSKPIWRHFVIFSSFSIQSLPN